MLMTTNKAADDSPPNDSPALSADEGAALYRLMTWLSPAFPVGAFSYSSGIEWAVEACDITDAASLQDWLSAMLSDGAGFCDGVFLAHVHRATSDGDDKALREVAELASAFVPSRERQLETTTQGKAFIEIARNAWSHEGMEPDRLSRRRRTCECRAWCAAVGNHAWFFPRGGLELDFRWRAAGAARSDRQPARTCSAGACRRDHRPSRYGCIPRRSWRRDIPL
jgi:hypothetical protein